MGFRLLLGPRRSLGWMGWDGDHMGGGWSLVSLVLVAL